MYEMFYGFRERPFQLTPDPEFMFLAKHHRAGLSALEYGLVQQTPISLITGEVGCGKTTLIRYLLSRIQQDITVGLISNTSRNFGRLLQWAAMAFGLAYRDLDDVALYDNLTQFFVLQYAMGRHSVLIVDEAQNLTAPVLEELRVLSNINADKHVVLQIVLVGQPELLATIRSSNMRQLAQRIGISHHIDPLTPAESRHYIRHRLRVVGGRLSIFTNEAVELVAQVSGGVPRLINQLCDAALVYGYAERWTDIHSGHMRQVVEDKLKAGVFPRPSAVAGVHGVSERHQPRVSQVTTNKHLSSDSSR